ncbi:hypothetical protein M0R45_005668 [Rubus argutus]|uniref:Uncharacterized protein n=1 Tax=Rubus argutus TaxID=59490 RepID=A0AAW1YNS6_RUBAR
MSSGLACNWVADDLAWQCEFAGGFVNGLVMDKGGIEHGLDCLGGLIVVIEGLAKLGCCALQEMAEYGLGGEVEWWALIV